MSREYDEYLEDHINAVKECYKMISGEELASHDGTKYDSEEYFAYDSYFYTDSKHDVDVKSNFDYAWLHHQNHNKHHWQYWVLINDEDGIVPMDMPGRYINEMVADWGAFSLLKKDGKELKKWYSSHKNKIIISDYTRTIVEEKVDILSDLIDKRIKNYK